VTPDGRVTAGDLDLFATRVGTTVAGNAMATAVVVDAEAARAVGIDPSIVTAALERVELAHTAAAATHPVAVAADGTWRVGPLTGATTKDEIELIGAAARERARQRQLAGLAERIAEQKRTISGLAAELTVLSGRDSTIDEERRALPPATPVIEARQALTIKAERRRRATDDLTGRRKVEAEADDRSWQEQDKVRLLLEAHGLVDWATRLDQYEGALVAWQDAVGDWLSAAAERVGQLNLVADRFVAHAEDEAQASAMENAHRDADLAALEAESRYQTLLDAVGVPFQRLKGEMAGVETELTANGNRRTELRDRKVQVAGDRGGAQKALETVEADRAARLAEREAADASLAALAARGVLAAAGFPELLAPPTRCGRARRAGPNVPTVDLHRGPSTRRGGSAHPRARDRGLSGQDAC
jgi:hypothetical protein